MGFCKPGDNCFNSSIVAQINKSILERQSEKERLEDCGVTFPNLCPEILACLSGGTGGGTSYWSATTSGDIHNLGPSTVKVGVGVTSPTNKLHINTNDISSNPLRVETLQVLENSFVTVDSDGVFYKSEHNSRIINGGTF
tara:strand:- start:2525 stop:2944 length:420 start_codon:yes stop_codon:yes gene_type:complete